MAKKRKRLTRRPTGYWQSLEVVKILRAAHKGDLDWEKAAKQLAVSGLPLVSVGRLKRKARQALGLEGKEEKATARA